MIYDTSKKETVVSLLDPVTVTADTNCASVDLSGYTGVTFIVSVGVSADTLSGSVKYEIEVQDSADDTSFAAVANALVIDGVTGTNTGTFGIINSASTDSAVYSAGYIGNKRYVRPVINATGTHALGTPISVVAVLHGKQHSL